MTVVVTGAAGFIGFHVAQALLGAGRTVIGIDNLNDYYDPQLKRAVEVLLDQISPDKSGDSPPSQPAESLKPAA